VVGETKFGKIWKESKQSNVYKSKSKSKSRFAKKLKTLNNSYHKKAKLCGWRNFLVRQKRRIYKSRNKSGLRNLKNYSLLKSKKKKGKSKHNNA
jgi:hypothetical protein